MKGFKLILTIIVITVILVFLNIREVKGAIQANKNTQGKKMDIITNWMTNFRKMETDGESMGLNETLNEDLTSSSESNNIDVHMIKMTEYGAISILSASGYGNSSKVITSTTGNNTGMIINLIDYESTAGELEGYVFTGINERYYNKYTLDRESAKVGDALGTATNKNPGCYGWHEANYMDWFKVNKPVLLRDTGSIFSYFGDEPNYIRCSRGAVVCGIGL